MSYGNYGNNPEYSDTRYTGPDPYTTGPDFSSAADHAASHHDGNRDLFTNALSFIQDRASQYQGGAGGDIDEEHAVKAHQAMYGSGGAGESRTHDSGTVGAGAAMQALKMFTSGGQGDGGMDLNKLIGLAMAQAGKLWDEKAGRGDSMVSLSLSLSLFCCVLDCCVCAFFCWFAFLGSFLLLLWGGFVLTISRTVRRQAIRYQQRRRDGYQDVHEERWWTRWDRWTRRTVGPGEQVYVDGKPIYCFCMHSKWTERFS